MQRTLQRRNQICDQRMEVLIQFLGGKKNDRPFLYDWCFPDRILHMTSDGVLMLLQHGSSKSTALYIK
jgi:hypothetical protein